MAADINRDAVVIDPIGLPATLKAMGYSEDVAAYRLWDEMVRINEGTPTAKDRVAFDVRGLKGWREGVEHAVEQLVEDALVEVRPEYA